MRDFDRGYPARLRPNDRGAADEGRDLEVLSGNADGASQTNICCLPPPPGVRRRAVGGVLASSSSRREPWRVSDAEAKRRRRVAVYKVYTVESNVKASIRKGLRWFKGIVRGR